MESSESLSEVERRGEQAATIIAWDKASKTLMGRFTPARTLKAEAEDKEGMWEGGENSSDEEEDEDENSEESESSDGEPSTVLPSRTTTSNSAAGPSTVAGPSATTADGRDKFGNLPEISAREAKKLAKQERAKKAQANSDSSDEDDILRAGANNSGLSKQMKASSLGSSDSKPSKPAAQGMNRKERYAFRLHCFGKAHVHRN